jgi:hypothetical protein
MSVLTLALAVALSAAPNAKTQLKIEVKPSVAVIYLDGKKLGSGDKVHMVNVKPGTHALRVVYRGDEHSEEVLVKKDQVLTWKWSFEDEKEESKIPVEDKSRSKAKSEPDPSK